MKLVAYNVNCISFLIAVHSTLFLNPQNFYFMNDVLFFCMYLQILLNVCFIYMSSWLYVLSFVYIPPYIVATSTFLRFRNETLFHDQISVTSEPGSTGCEKILIYLSELLCMWPAIFLIAPDALIIPGT